MEHNHVLLGEFHFCLVQNVAVLQADVVLLVEKPFFLHARHVEDVHVADYVFQPLVTVFSIFRNVESYWYRYSYTGIFLLCVLAAAFFLKGYDIRTYHPLLCGALFALLSVLSTIKFHDKTQQFIYASDVKTLYGIALSSDLSVALAKVVLPLIFAVVLFLVFLDKHGLGSGFNVTIVSIVTALELVLAGGLLFLFYSNDKADRFSSYVVQESKLVEQVKASDEGGFYRVSQTSNRSVASTGNTANYNEGLGYGFNAISSFVSDPEEKQGEFLAKLGYPFHSETITVTNSPIIPADSILGVRYVLSEYDCPGMQKVTNNEGFKNAYKNPYCLPEAFIVSDVPGVTAAKNPFDYQNQVYSAILGEKIDLFGAAEFDVVNEERSTEYKVLLPGGNYALYGWLRPDEGVAANVDVNGIYKITIGKFLSPDAFVIPISGDNEYASVKVSTSEHVHADFYILDLDEFGEVIERIRAGKAKSAEIRPGYAKVTAEGVSGGEKLYISVPYDSSWKVMRNGTEIVPETFGGCMTVVTLEKGMNEIVMEYCPPHMTAGIISSCVGIVMTVTLAFIYRKKGRSAKEK